MLKFLPIPDRHWHSDSRNNGPQLLHQAALDKRFRDHIILEPGDVTDDGHVAQYERVREAMESWKGRWFFCPGNHDYGIAGVFYDPVRALRFDEMLSLPFAQGGSFNGLNLPVVNLIQDGKDKVLIIALDSNLETESPWDFACGEIGQPQLDGLSRVLREAPEDAVKIVMMHHHPWMHWHPFMRLLDANKLLNRLKGKVDVLLFGHRHVAGEWYGRWGIPLTLAAPSTPQAGWFNEITIEGKAISVRKIQWRV